MQTNPNAMLTIDRNTMFTNIGETDDGDYYWEGLEKDRDITGKKITDWKGNAWTPGSGNCSHPNAR